MEREISQRNAMAVADRIVTARAPGKINICFKAGQLQSNGRRNIASLCQAVSLFTEISAAPARTFAVAAKHATTIRAKFALSAAQLLAARTGYAGGVVLSRSPKTAIAAGLAGDAAAAAATLVACNELWGTALTRGELCHLATELSPEVVFALEGGTALGTSGNHQRLSPVLAQGSFHWVLVPGKHAGLRSTLTNSTVLSMLDQHRQDHRQALGQIKTHVAVEATALHAVRAADPEALAEVMHNDLQAAVLKLAPQLVELLQLGESCGALAGIVSDSGPTIAFLACDALAAAQLKTELERAGEQAIIASGPVAGARLVSK